MEVYGYIYLVKNLINGKMYFGKTENDFDTRYCGNILKRTHNEHLKRSIKKYGIENFEINEQFDIAYTEDDLWDLEDMYICLYDTLDSRYGYNKRRSGSKHKGNGKLSEESRKKMSEARKGKTLSEEHKHKLSESHKGEKNGFHGKSHTEETKRKISEAHKGEKSYWYGKKHSEETKHKTSESHKGKMVGEDNPMYGKKHSEEARHKMSEALKGKYTGSKSGRAKKVICLETKQVFNTIKEAGEWCGTNNVRHHLKGRNEFAGKHPITGEKLHWMYYDEYLEKESVA